MSVLYKTLFTIEILHDYYGEKGFNQDSVFIPDLQLIPASDTMALMENSGIIFKNYENQFKAFIRSEENPASLGNYKPLIDPGKVVFRFYIEQVNSYWKNFTELGSDDRELYIYLSNDNSYSSDGKIYLCKSANNVVGKDDLVKLNTSIYRFDFSSSTPGTLQLLRFNETTGSFDILAFEQDFSQTDFSADVSSLSPALYLQCVKDLTDELVYIDDELSIKKYLGVVEIAIDDHVEEALLDDDGNLVSPAPIYTIHFKNRWTFWRYTLVSSDLVISDITLEDPIQFTKTGNVIESLSAIGLTKDPITTLQLTKDGDSFTVDGLRNPDVYSISQKNNKIYSDIFLNY